MRTWAIDWTISDRDLTTEQAVGIVHDMLAAYPDATAENWCAGGACYWRVLFFVSADTMRDAMLWMQTQGRSLLENKWGLRPDQPAALSMAIRDVSFPVVETMPPAARRAIRGGRPPKNPPSRV